MILDNLRILLKLYVRPVGAISEILDRGNWLFGALAVVVVSALLEFGLVGGLYRSYEAPPPKPGPTAPVAASHPQARPSQAPPAVEDSEEEDGVSPRNPLPLLGQRGWWFVSFSTTSVLASVVALALLYVPLTLLLVNLQEHQGSLSMVLQRNYGAVLTCTFMAWAAAHLPFALAGVALGAAHFNPIYLLALWLPAKLAFGALMVLVLRTVLGASMGTSLRTVGVAWVSVIFESFLGWLASPFVLFMGYYYFRSDVGDIFSSFRTRQSYRRYLEASTLNPRDSEAHYQLGLIHQQRRQYSQAIERFQRAVEIDPGEADAHYQLGRIAREQGKLDDALQHFQSAAAHDQQHAQYEVWREIGEAQAAAGKPKEARRALEFYVDKRPYDPQGLCYLGETLAKLDERQAAREMFERAIEAEKTNPYSHRENLRKWRRLAEKQLRGLRG